MLIEPFFLESPSALIKPSSSGAFNPQLEASLLIAVKTVMSVTLLNRSQHEDAGGQKSSHFGLPWEVLFMLESPLCCLCELQPGLSPPRGPRQRRPELAV